MFHVRVFQKKEEEGLFIFYFLFQDGRHSLLKCQIFVVFTWPYISNYPLCTTGTIAFNVQADICDVCKKHFHWKISKSMGNFGRGIKAKTSRRRSISPISS